MSLGECMEKHTHRQYLAWMAWLDEQWNKPSREDYYLMQIACAVINRGRERSTAVTVEEMKMKFKEPEPPLTKEEQIAFTKAKWAFALGINPEDIR